MRILWVQFHYRYRNNATPTENIEWMLLILKQNYLHIRKLEHYQQKIKRKYTAKKFRQRPKPGKNILSWSSSVDISTLPRHLPAYSSVIAEQFVTVVINCQSDGSCNNFFEEPVSSISLSTGTFNNAVYVNPESQLFKFFRNELYFIWNYILKIILPRFLTSNTLKPNLLAYNSQYIFFTTKMINSESSGTYRQYY